MPQLTARQKARIVELALLGELCEMCKRRQWRREVFAVPLPDGGMEIGRTQMCLACYTSWATAARLGHISFGEWALLRRKELHGETTEGAEQIGTSNESRSKRLENAGGPATDVRRER